MKIYTIGLILLCGATAQGVILASQNKILQALVSSHNGAFGKDNIYREPITADQLKTWNNAIKEAKIFVMQNSSNIFGTPDSTLTRALSIIESANIDLVNAIKITRGSLSSPSATKHNIETLSRIKRAMITVRNDLDNASFISNKANKMIAKELLVNMAMFIETTAAKAIKDTAK